MRDHILQKATLKFLHEGFKNVTVDDIARTCGISKKTLYEYFENKKLLIRESLLSYFENTRREHERVARESKNAIQELVGIYFDMDKMMRNFNPVCILDLQKYYPKSFEIIEEYKRRIFYNEIQKNLVRGQKEGYFRQEINVDVMSQYRLETAFLVFHGMLFQPGKFQLAEVNREIFEHYMYGIATKKGHDLIKKYLSKK